MFFHARSLARLATAKGFTLIELLVVIGVIGILAAVMLASMRGAVGKSGNARYVSQLENFRAAAEVYYADRHNYGSDLANTICTASAGDAYNLYDFLRSQNYGGVAPVCTTDAVLTGLPARKYSAYITLSDNTHFCVDNLASEKNEPVSWSAPTNGDPCP
jgi:prepilin-type N-terminal cleavage/methylation domain-containing protein